MFRFSCFHAHVPSNKAKKTIVQPYTEAMAKVSKHDFPKLVSDDSSITATSNPSPPKAQVHKQMDVNGGICISEDPDNKLTFESDIEVRQTRHIKKSYSLASGLCREGRQYTGCVTKGDADPGFSSDGSKSHTESPVSVSGDDHDIISTDQCEKNTNSQFQFSSAHANVGSIFSIGELTLSDKDAHQISDTLLSGKLSGDSADQTSGPSTPSLMKSHSVPDFNAPVVSTGKSTYKHPPSISRSSDDLHALGKGQKEVFINESDDQITGDQGRDNNAGKIEDSHIDSYFNDGFDSYLASGSAKDWVMPITDGMRDDKTLQGDSSVDCFGEYPNGDFKIKRIEDWVIGLQHCGPPLEEINEVPESVDPLVDVNTKNVATAAEVDHKDKVTPGMEVAKRYISSLSANATAAHLINHGLVVIPFLSAFVSLKVLNLAGNAIVRITAGALPRGLHVLNLSKNNISTIEGLRELTRLRVLDLSYNRIVRIGHGLASCSSLKELYLAGNKISEVEGLHRLLKLSILDLRFNKISTAKCLGQLAANYNSLQAISLEGNPAQKNVGDEQLKKNLQGLLPHLVYYNRQPIQVSTLKDGADRSVRLGMSSHQLDRSIRSDRKTTTRKISRASTSSTHARRSQIVEPPKLSKGKQSQLPPPSRTRTHSRYHFEVPGKALDITSDLSIRKSRSEGTLRVL